MSLVVTSATGTNGDGYGALLAFDDDGKPLGPFTRDTPIADPRGLAVHRKDGLLFINSATDRVLAIDRNGVVLRDSGPIVDRPFNRGWLSSPMCGLLPVLGSDEACD